MVFGESDRPLPDVLQVVVVQEGSTADGRGEITHGRPLRASTNWTAELPGAGFKAGRAEALGVEIRVSPFEVTSWTQSVEIE
jgi:hypothetical protein